MQKKEIIHIVEENERLNTETQEKNLKVKESKCPTSSGLKSQ